MPVDGSVVPPSQPFLPTGVVAKGMIGCRGNVGAKHAKKIKDDPHTCPAVILAEAPHQEDDAHYNAKDNAPRMRPGIPQFFLMGVFDHSYSFLTLSTGDTMKSRMLDCFFYQHKSGMVVYFSIKTTAYAEIPSSRPVKPSRSVVVALIDI